MSMYPSLEDMKVDQLARAQVAMMTQQQQQQHQHPVPPAIAPAPHPMPTPYPLNPASAPAIDAKLYPALDDYMGLDLSAAAVARHMPNAVAIPPANQVRAYSPSAGMVAPLSGNSVGLKRAEVTHGIREVMLCKNQEAKIGLRVKGINKGVFVVLVMRNSPAALAGLRFGDQILQINGQNVAGMDTEKVHSIFKKCGSNNISVAVRDRPYERTITLHKDSIGHVGFGFNRAKIEMIVKDSSAARNGLVTDHHLLEVNGQNVVGLKDKDITKILAEGGNIITVTIMPSFIYEHMMKHMAGSLVREHMDHSIQDI